MRGAAWVAARSTMRAQLYDHQPPSLIRRRRVLAFGTFAATATAVAVVTATTLGGGGGGGGDSGASLLAALPAHPVRVTIIGHLAQAVQRAPGASAGALLVLGGLDRTGAPTGSIQRLGGASVRIAGRLPSVLAGSAAVALANTIYVFGGASGGFAAPPSSGSAQAGAAGAGNAILAVGGQGSGPVRQAGRLTTGVTDAGAAMIAGTAFVVGGYDGSREVDGVLAWRPGGAGHRTAHLPVPLRFAAVAGAGGVVIIAGGVSGGRASRGILRFDPARHRVTRIGQLPVDLAHAAAATLGGLVFVVGGRGSGAGSQMRAIYAIDPRSGRTALAGVLPEGLSDTAIATVGDRILIAGGINRAGKVQRGVLGLMLRPRS